MPKDEVVGLDWATAGIFELGQGYQGITGIIHFFLYLGLTYKNAGNPTLCPQYKHP